MKKQSYMMKEVKQWDMMSVVIGVSVLFSALMAVLGYESLSIGNAMVLVVFCVLTFMAKDLKEFCNGLVKEEE